MTDAEILRDIPGAQALCDLLGFWPSFHDAEIVSVCLDRAGASKLVVHTFGSRGEVDSTGHYVTERHTLVTFVLSEVTDTQILGFNKQNVVSGIALNKDDDGYKVTLGGCYGAEGWLKSRSLALTLEPGIPSDSVYLKSGGAP